MSKLVFLETVQFVFIFYIQVVTGLPGQKCKPTDLVNSEVCPIHASCNTQTKYCECNNGYTLRHNVCVKDDGITSANQMSPNSSSLVDTNGGGHVVAAVLVPMFLITILVLGVYFGRKYKMFTWVRNKISQRNTHYDEFMIGQDPDDDDPPLR